MLNSKLLSWPTNVYMFGDDQVATCIVMWIHLHRPISYIQNQIYHVISICIYTYKTLMYRMHVCVSVCDRSFTREPLDLETWN